MTWMLRRTFKAAVGTTVAMVAVLIGFVLMGEDPEGLGTTMAVLVHVVALIVGQHIIREDARTERRKNR